MKFIVMGIMDTTLRNIIHSPAITPLHYKWYMYQILCGLKYLHSANIIHRDLKPHNILVNSVSDLKIIDFGLSRGVKFDTVMTPQNVTTLWYRAPEVLLGCSNYSFPIDIWAAGCIFAEFFIRNPLFPGDYKNGDQHIQQLNLITDLLGNPNPEELKYAHPSVKLYYEKQKYKYRYSIDQKCNINDPLAAELCSRMLTLNPIQRITIDEALQHPYFNTSDFTELRSLELEQFLPPAPFDFSWENPEEGVESCQRIKELMWKDVNNYSF